MNTVEYNLLANLQACKDVFDASAGFVEYLHILPVVLVLVFGGFVLYSKRDKAALLLGAVSLLFSLYVVFDLLQWMETDQNTLIVTTWAVLGLLAALLFFFVHWFVHEFVTHESLPAWMVLVWLIALLPVFVLTPTAFNIQSFDIASCAANEGAGFTNYYYALGGLSFLLMLVSGYRGFRAKSAPGEELAARALVLAGACLFVITFLATGILASYLVDAGYIPDFGIDQYGFAAMAVFIGLLGYITVRYHAFNLKLLGAQALVIALALLVAAELLFVQNSINFWLVGFTLVLVIGFGWLLVRSVKQEVRQRERIEVLAKDLEAANERLKELDRLKNEFLSIASHQLRAPITAIKGYAANILDSTYGPVPASLVQPLGVIQESARLMVNSIEDYLNISRIEQGRMKYEKSDFDLAKLAAQVVNELQPVAAVKQVALAYQGSGPAMICADIGKMKQVITNLIDNAIKYTEHGSVSVSVETRGGSAVFTTADTGVGIAADDIGKLFSKFTRARDANKVNTTGTGLGLYVAKQLTEGNGGSVRAESPGVGKGSRFIVELPAKQPGVEGMPRSV